ncbi:MAG TPA: hypothetical protein VGF23_23675 [Gaiellaceae bacterium]|jgi:hypothetical protein
MSGQIGAKSLPFTGFATLPLVAVGLVLTGLGWVMTTFGAKKARG